MRVLLGLAFVAVIVLLVWVAVKAYSVRQHKLRQALESEWAYAVSNARWEDYIRGNESETKVIVRKVARISTGEERELKSQVIDTIPNDVVDWHVRYDAARITAAERAISLNMPPLNG